MKKNPITRLMVGVLTLAMVCTSVLAVPDTTVEAAPKAKEIRLSATKKTIFVNHSFELKVKSVKPSKASKSVTFKSSNEKVAVVKSDGEVVGMKPGKATITATSKSNSKVKATCRVTVKQHVDHIRVKQAIRDKVVVPKGKSLKLKVTVDPKSAQNKKLSYTIKNKKIATVNSKGKITGKSYGSTRLIIKALDGGGTTVILNVYVPKVRVKKVKLNKSSVTMDVGESLKLKARVLPEKASAKYFSFKSSKPSVVKVGEFGRIWALKPGKATITATTLDGSKKAKCTVTVRKVKVSKITLVPEKQKIMVGESFMISAKISPSNATDKSLAWTSSNTSILTVDQGGKVKALKKGTATVTATAKDGSGKKGTCVVTVDEKVCPEPPVPENPVLVHSVTLVPEEATIRVGETTGIAATVEPEDAYNKKLTWTSNNNRVATVDKETGVVTAVSPGTAIITATALDGSEESGTCMITVVPEGTILPESVTIVPEARTLRVDDTATFTATVSPAGADQTVSWRSSDPTVATVENGIVTAKGAGIATITAESINGKIDTCEVTVISLTIDQSELDLKANNKTTSLVATVRPAGAATVVWSSSNPAVVTVDPASGLLTPVAAGEATVTAKVTTEAGDLERICKVTVIERTNAFSETDYSYVYTFDKTAVSYDAEPKNGGMIRSVLSESVASDQELVAGKLDRLWENDFLKKYWNDITTETLKESAVFSELFLGQLTITGSTPTTKTIQLNASSQSRTLLVERVDGDRFSSLVVTDQRSGRKIYLNEIEVIDGPSSIRFRAQISGSGPEGRVMVLEVGKDAKSASLQIVANNTFNPVVSFATTDDSYVLTVSKAYYNELLGQFGSMENFIADTDVWNVYTE